MATGGPPPSENITADDFGHCCSLCMEPYRGRCPKLLPCFHTFCLPCLTALADNAARSGTGEGGGEKDLKSDDKEEDAESGGEKKTEENEGGTEDKTEDDHHGDTFLCPTCRAPVVIPEGGVTALQTNFYIDYDDDQGPLLCQICEVGQEREATHFCPECEQRLCRECRGMHGRFPSFRGHGVEEIPARPLASNTKSSAHGKRWCQYHPDQVLCFHCCKCDVSICLHCKLTSHEGHETEDMVTAARRAREELAGVMAKAKEQLRSVNACLSRLERDTQDLHRQKQEITKQVNARHELLTVWADRARDETLETLSAKAETALTDITMEKTSAAVAKETISEVMTRASVKTTYGPDLVLLKSELQAALLKDEAMDRFKELAARKEHKTFLTCTADPTALDLDLLRVYMGDMAEVEDAGSALTLNFREMAAKVTALEAELKDKSMVPKVSFHAQDTGKSYSSRGKIIFNQVDCNNGNGYNPSDGVFTAPEAGTYMFMATVRCSTNGTAIHAYLSVRSNPWAYMYAPESATVHATVSLNKGDQVCVVSCSNFASGGNYTFFSGAMISF